MMRRHWIALVLVVIGIMLGMGMTTGIETLMAKRLPVGRPATILALRGINFHKGASIQDEFFP